MAENPRDFTSLMYAYALGCLDEEDKKLMFDYFKAGGDHPWQDLGELQNLTALLPSFLTIEEPSPTLKDKVARTLYRIREQKRVAQLVETETPPVVAKPSPPPKVEAPEIKPSKPADIFVDEHEEEIKEEIKPDVIITHRDDLEIIEPVEEYKREEEISPKIEEEYIYKPEIETPSEEVNIEEPIIEEPIIEDPTSSFAKTYSPIPGYEPEIETPQDDKDDFRPTSRPSEETPRAQETQIYHRSYQEVPDRKKFSTDSDKPISTQIEQRKSYDGELPSDKSTPEVDSFSLKDTKDDLPDLFPEPEPAAPPAKEEDDSNLTESFLYGTDEWEKSAAADSLDVSSIGTTDIIEPTVEKEIVTVKGGMSLSSIIILIVVVAGLVGGTYYLLSEKIEEKAVTQTNELKETIRNLQLQFEAKGTFEEMIKSPDAQLVNLKPLDPNSKAFGKLIFDIKLKKGVIQLAELPKLNLYKNYFAWVKIENDYSIIGKYNPEEGNNLLNLENFPDLSEVNQAQFIVSEESSLLPAVPSQKIHLIGSYSK